MSTGKSIAFGALFALLFASSGLAAQPGSAGVAAGKNGSEPPIKALAFVICAFEGAGAEQKCGALGGSPTYTVPTNRTFIIEQVTGTCGSDDSSAATVTNVELNVVTNHVSVDHLLVATRPAGSGLSFTVSDDTRIYADRGSTVSLTIFGIPAISDRYCRLAFSGRLVR